MNTQEAKRLLANPKFGDPDCIAAVKFLEVEAEAVRLRAKLKGKLTECWCCNGSGEISCKAMCVHVCPTCEGDHKLTLSASILNDLDVYQLRDLAKEHQLACT